MLTWKGSTDGEHDSEHAWAAMTARVYGTFDFAGIRFYAVDPGTYAVTLGATTLGYVTSPGGEVAELLFDQRRVTHSATISIGALTTVTVRYNDGGPLELAPGIVQGPWAHFDDRQLPWELLTSDALSTDTPGDVICPGYVEGHPHSMPGHVVNGANGNGTTMPTSGRGHPRGRF